MRQWLAGSLRRGVQLEALFFFDNTTQSLTPMKVDNIHYVFGKFCRSRAEFMSPQLYEIFTTRNNGLISQCSMESRYFQSYYQWTHQLALMITQSSISSNSRARKTVQGCQHRLRI
ncbi:hypothetical protein FPOAC2_05629 [Fusarium poae]